MSLLQKTHHSSSRLAMHTARQPPAGLQQQQQLLQARVISQISSSRQAMNSPQQLQWITSQLLLQMTVQMSSY
jgi:hypothetical protein